MGRMFDGNMSERIFIKGCHGNLSPTIALLIAHTVADGDFIYGITQGADLARLAQ
jgi:hypothetical protein